MFPAFFFLMCLRGVRREASPSAHDLGSAVRAIRKRRQEVLEQFVIFVPGHAGFAIFFRCFTDAVIIFVSVGTCTSVRRLM